eukprot:gnl/MRDRNA2_/MRDRNA2_76924_c0_seq1.p1 gnl/MRDRNA2_/MRDRNA2_76924_c0~~gnl/MRDRNA2_/MRDRNA2_76924_c0_seq1.p1  ORF type:complete len:304 (+),score=34.23 gnl/MRDRNA2_/MRDRNA2_76924_c0_seq1:58-969(+)
MSSDQTQDQAITQLASKHLGKTSGNKVIYDASLLVKIPRKWNREGYDLSGEEFFGYDVWNAYEVSAITSRGQPVAGMMKIVCPASSEFHVESKSMKLYLNSFNMTQIGDTAKECIAEIEERVSRDLTQLCEADVTATFYKSYGEAQSLSFEGYTDVADAADLDSIDFTAFKSDSSQLEISDASTDKVQEVRFRSNLLRSNCRVTEQPDWGDIFIKLEGKKLPAADSLAKYIVSHRTVMHFHEEICEMVFKHLNDAYVPEKLMVACLYTRRGGIDINPVRASEKSLIPDFFTDRGFMIGKTLRQ